MAIRTTISALMMAGAMCCSANAQSANSDPLPRAKPEEVGLSSERLADIAKTLNADIARGQFPASFSPSRATASSPTLRRSASATRWPARR